MVPIVFEASIPRGRRFVLWWGVRAARSLCCSHCSLRNSDAFRENLPFSGIKGSHTSWRCLQQLQPKQELRSHHSSRQAEPRMGEAVRTLVCSVSPLTRTPAPVSSRPTSSWLSFYSWIVCCLTGEFNNTWEKDFLHMGKWGFFCRVKNWKPYELFWLKNCQGTQDNSLFWTMFVYFVMK